MKRFIILFTALSLLLATSACSDTDKKEATDEVKTTVSDIENSGISETEFSYQIRTTYSSLCSLVSQYEQYYGYNVLGFNSEVPPDEQLYTADETDENSPGNLYDTWMDYIADTAFCAIQERKVLCTQAESAGIKLDEDDTKKIDDLIAKLKTNSLSDTEFDNYLKNAYGDGMTLEIFRKIQEEATLADKFEKYKTNEYYESYSLSDIEKIYEKNKADYGVVDLAVYAVGFTSENKADAKKNADKILSQITDEASFDKLVKKSENNAKIYNAITGSSMDEIDSTGKIKEWAFDTQRKTGDKKIIETENSFFVIYMLNPCYDTFAYSSRHILFQFDEIENVTDSDWDSLLTDTEKVLNEWKNGSATEESFAELANKYSTDAGSNTNGGLYENIEPGSFVKEYENWCLDPERKNGDVTIVKVDASNYKGYHIIYFISLNEMPVWENKIRTEKSSEDYLNYSTEIFKNECNKYMLDSTTFDACVSDSLQHIKLLINQSSSSE